MSPSTSSSVSNSVSQKLAPLTYFKIAAIGGVIAWSLGQVTTLYMGIATLGYWLLASGFILRKSDKKSHGILMTAGIVTDVSLVLVLEFQRSAINTAVSFTLGPLQQAHILSSTVATVLYFPLLYIGWALYRGKLKSPKVRRFHKRAGITAFIFRSIGFLLMFTLLASSH